VALLFASGAEVYPRFAGSRPAGLAVLATAFQRACNTASAEVVWVAEVDGRLVEGEGYACLECRRSGSEARPAPLR
jgi:hypothetical protein